MRGLKFSALCLCLCVGALVLSGCGVFDRSYTSVSTHVEQRVTEDDPSVLRAETYQELVSAVLHFVTEGEETGTVRLYQYTGDVESDLEAACQEVLTQEALGAYALETLEQTYNRILSYYECTFTLTYRRTQAEIDAIVTTSTMVAFREQLQQAMDEFSPTLAVRTGLNLTQERVQELVEEYYFATPVLALGCPAVTVTQYGEGSGQKIIELELTWFSDQERSQTQQQELLLLAEQLVEGLELPADATEEERLWSVYQTLSTYIIYQGSGAGSAYRFLNAQAGNRQGATMALMLLCEQLGIEATYVSGTDAEGGALSWLIVQVDDRLYHVDLMLRLQEGDFLLTDDELAALGYSWDRESYPACEGEESEVAEAVEETAEEVAPNQLLIEAQQQ